MLNLENNVKGEISISIVVVMMITISLANIFKIPISSTYSLVFGAIGASLGGKD